jgi:hypothetical protein
MQADGREVNWQAAIQLHTSLDCFDELWYISMTRTEARISVDDANNRSRKGIFGVSKGFNKYFPEKEREVRISV